MCETVCARACVSTSRRHTLNISCFAHAHTGSYSHMHTHVSMHAFTRAHVQVQTHALSSKVPPVALSLPPSHTRYRVSDTLTLSPSLSPTHPRSMQYVRQPTSMTAPCRLQSPTATASSRMVMLGACAPAPDEILHQQSWQLPPHLHAPCMQRGDSSSPPVASSPFECSETSRGRSTGLMGEISVM